MIAFLDNSQMGKGTFSTVRILIICGILSFALGVLNFI